MNIIRDVSKEYSLENNIVTENILKENITGENIPEIMKFE